MGFDRGDLSMRSALVTVLLLIVWAVPVEFSQARGWWLSLHPHAIDFFDRSEPAPAGPSGRIFHLAITAGNRSRELAINDPFETPELAHLITLTRRAMRDRQVLSPNMLDGVQFAALAAAWLDARSANPGNDPSC